MSKSAWSFKPRELKRALLATVDAGLVVHSVEFGKDLCRIVTVAEAPSSSVDDLDQELAKFEARNGQD
jgi:hypothetical protein